MESRIGPMFGNDRRGLGVQEVEIKVITKAVSFQNKLAVCKEKQILNNTKR